MKREIERVAGRGRPRVSAGAARSGVPSAATSTQLTYVGFEDRFRGVRARFAGVSRTICPSLTAAADVVDVGLRTRRAADAASERKASTASGVDTNAAMVELCRSQGLDVEQGDAVSYLERHADGSIGGLVAIQVVEHFDPAYLAEVSRDGVSQDEEPGAPLILETINPACWMAFFETYIRDLTHQRPLHPDTLRYLVQASGFTAVDVQFRQPVTAGDRLQARVDRRRSAGTSAGRGSGDGRQRPRGRSSTPGCSRRWTMP